MGYTYATLGDLKTAAANRLDDPAKVYWVDDELAQLITEAFRVWQTLTAYWRGVGVFTPTAGTAAYDLSAVVPALMARTVTDQQAIFDLEYALLEPKASPYAGSAQFTATDLVSAVERRRNQFLDETGCVVTVNAPFLVQAGDGIVDLPTALGHDRVISIRRGQWITTAGRYSNVMQQTKPNAVFFRSFQQSGLTPYGYDPLSTSPQQIQLVPPPSDLGQLELWTVNAGTTLTGLGVVLGVPDNLSWAVRWGAMSDLLSRQGRGYDPALASICEDMYGLGVSAATSLSAILSARLDGRDIYPDSVYELDTAYVGWQGKKAAAPVSMGTMGWNTICLRPVPDSFPHSVTMDLVQNAPVPTADTLPIQAGREVVDALLDYTEFAATAKLGYHEFAAAREQCFKRFLAVAEKYSGRVASLPYGLQLTREGDRQDKTKPQRRSTRKT